MRNLTACFVAALLSSTALTAPRHAEACGGSYESFRAAPQVMVVSSVAVYPDIAAGEQGTINRAFAITNANLQLELAPGQSWKRISPHSYDSTQMISLDKLARSTAVTLVGPSGTRVLRSDRRVALHHAMFVSNSTFDAIELPVGLTDEFPIALAGSHRDAVWHASTPSYSTSNGIDGTDLNVWHKQVDGKPTVELRQLRTGTFARRIGTYEGYVLGAIDVGTARYVVISTNRGSAFTVEVAKS